MRRFQIRNRYGNEGLSRSTTYDDPEVFLEAISVAGLVDVLRLVGDLAEFAAEIFHDLHQDVEATASRSRGIINRVQQLEADIPTIDKFFVVRTHHSQFFTICGADWHSEILFQENILSRSVVPSFVMDAWDKCRDPPHLFLLDKFDVAGAGACLKRYTDPAFFRTQAEESKHRETVAQRIHKTPKPKRIETVSSVLPSDHDPSDVVKLKSTRSNKASFVEVLSRKYLEKFRQTVLEESWIKNADDIKMDSHEDTDSCDTENYMDALNTMDSETETDDNGVFKHEQDNDVADDNDAPFLPTDGCPTSEGIIKTASDHSSAESTSSQLFVSSAMKSISDMVDANLTAVSLFLESQILRQSFATISEEKEEFQQRDGYPPNVCRFPPLPVHWMNKSLSFPIPEMQSICRFKQDTPDGHSAQEHLSLNDPQFLSSEIIKLRKAADRAASFNLSERDSLLQIIRTKKMIAKSSNLKPATKES